VRAAAAVLRDPRAGLDRLAERVGAIREAGGRQAHYNVTGDWHAGLARLLGPAALDEAISGFDDVWRQTVDTVSRHGLRLGRGAFYGWDDGDVAFARTAWCLARVLLPEAVVETGVARGFTSRVVLEALERNGRGTLWSVDLAPLAGAGTSDERGAAVIDPLRSRWRLIEGSSRQRLPGLLSSIGALDLFIHDSMHTRRNMVFELTRAWGALRVGGVLLADDVHRNGAFDQVIRAFGEPPSVVVESDDGEGLYGLIRKPPL